MSWERYNRIINAMSKTGVSWRDAAKALGMKDAEKLVAQGRVPAELGEGKRDNPSGTDLARYEAGRFIDEIIERAGSKGSREDAEVLGALQFQLGRASGLAEASATEKLTEAMEKSNEAMKGHTETLREHGEEEQQRHEQYMKLMRDYNDLLDKNTKTTIELNDLLGRKIAQNDELAGLRRRRSG